MSESSPQQGAHGGNPGAQGSGNTGAQRRADDITGDAPRPDKPTETIPQAPHPVAKKRDLPQVKDVIMIKHTRREQLAIVYEVSGDKFSVHRQNQDGCHGRVTFERHSKNWWPLPGSKKEVLVLVKDDEYEPATIQSAGDTEKTIKVLFKDSEGTLGDFAIYAISWPEAAGDASITGDKRSRTDDETGEEKVSPAEKEVRDWLSSIDLSEYADEVITKAGLKKLKVLKSKEARRKVLESCHKFMDELDFDLFVEEMNKFGEATVSVTLADIGKADSGCSATAPSLMPSSASQGGLSPMPSSASHSATDKPDLAASAAGTILGAAIEFVAADRTAAFNLKPTPNGNQGGLSASASVASGPTPPAPMMKLVPDYSQVDISGYTKLVENLKLDDDLKMFPKKFTYPPELTTPYIYQQQIIVGLLDLDKIPAPESAIVSIGTEFRGIGKSYLMGQMKAHLQGYALTLDPKIDFKEIEKRRGEPDEWGLFNERPLLYFDISKNEKKVVGDKVSFGTYFEDLSSGDKCGGRWNDSSRPLIIFIGNDHLKIESLGGFSGHRVHFYSIMSVGASFQNAQGITDFENYKLVVSKDMMAKIGKVAEEQVQKGGMERDAGEAGEETDIFIFLKYFKIVPYAPKAQKRDKMMKARDVANKLAELSKEHFGSLVSPTGKSFYQAHWTAWYEAKKAKLGSIPIHVWYHANQPQFNVHLKETPMFEKD